MANIFYDRLGDALCANKGKLAGLFFAVSPGLFLEGDPTTLSGELAGWGWEDMERYNPTDPDTLCEWLGVEDVVEVDGLRFLEDKNLPFVVYRHAEDEGVHVLISKVFREEHLEALDADVAVLKAEAAATKAEGGPPYDAATATGMYDHDG